MNGSWRSLGYPSLSLTRSLSLALYNYWEKATEETKSDWLRPSIMADHRILLRWRVWFWLNHHRQGWYVGDCILALICLIMHRYQCFGWELDWSAELPQYQYILIHDRLSNNPWTEIVNKSAAQTVNVNNGNHSVLLRGSRVVIIATIDSTEGLCWLVENECMVSWLNVP